MQAQVTPAPTPQAPVIAPEGPASAADMYQALRMQRRELDRQLETLEDRRDNITQELVQTPSEAVADRAGLEARLKETDARILAVEKQIEASDQAISRAAAIPGAVVEPPPPPPRQGPHPEEIITAIVFMGVLLLPVSIAYARKIWRRSSVVAPTLPPELWQRLSRLEEGVDAVAVEVERIGEGQRFTNKLFAESRSLGAGAAQPVETRASEPARAPRGEDV